MLLSIAMDDEDNIEANKSSDLKPLARRRGPPKGTPRPTGAGRRKGTPNRTTRDVRAAAQKHTTKALKTLVQLLSDKDSRVQATAAREILDRAHGKPMTPSEITGKDGTPLNGNYPLTFENRSQEIDVARRIAFALTKGTRAMQDTIRDGDAGPNVVALSQGVNDGR